MIDMATPVLPHPSHTRYEGKARLFWALSIYATHQCALRNVGRIGLSVSYIYNVT